MVYRTFMLKLSLKPLIMAILVKYVLLHLQNKWTSFSNSDSKLKKPGPMHSISAFHDADPVKLKDY